MSSLEYLKDLIELDTIKSFLKCENDETAKFLIASYVLNLLFISRKRLKTELATKLMLQGVDKKKVIRLSKISERTYFRLKKVVSDE